MDNPTNDSAVNPELKSCLGQATEPANIVIFGAGGDLTKRKLIPALVKMLRCGLLHNESKIIGVIKGRNKEEWLTSLKQGISDHAKELEVNDQEWQKFSAMFKMIDGDLQYDNTYQEIADSLENLGGNTHAMFYCAVPPRMYTTIAAGLHKLGLANEDEGFRRVVVEKPFGMDLKKCASTKSRTARVA